MKRSLILFSHTHHTGLEKNKYVKIFEGLCGLALPLPRFLTEVNVRLPDEPLAAHRLLRLRRVHKHTDTQASKVIVSKMKKIVLTKNKLGIQKSISMYQTLRSLLNIEHLHICK